jgi:hypothetical protein
MFEFSVSLPKYCNHSLSPYPSDAPNAFLYLDITPQKIIGDNYKSGCYSLRKVMSQTAHLVKMAVEFLRRVVW